MDKDNRRIEKTGFFSAIIFYHEEKQCESPPLFSGLKICGDQTIVLAV